MIDRYGVHTCLFLLHAVKLFGNPVQLTSISCKFGFIEIGQQLLAYFRRLKKVTKLVTNYDFPVFRQINCIFQIGIAIYHRDPSLRSG